MFDKLVTRKKSIASNTLFSLALRIAVIIIIMTGITYFHVTNEMTRVSLNQLTKYVAERGESSRYIFKLALDNHTNLKSIILDEFKLPPPSQDAIRQAFDKQFTTFPDGTVRTRLAGFDGKRQAGAFIGKGVKIDAALQRRVLLFSRLVNQHGPAWHHRLQNTYITTPENLIVEYWPEVPNWAHDIKAEMNMPDEEWFRIADKKNNPERISRWTGLFYDQVSALWMVSLETPVDYQGRHVATIGHDITLNDLITRTLNDHMQGSYNIIFSKDGRLIIHPDKLEAIKQKQGLYDIKTSNDAALQGIFNTVSTASNQETVLESPLTDDYLAMTYFPETDWYFVTVYPKALVKASAMSTARLILFLGVLSLLIELAIFYIVLRRQVSQPLQHVMQAVHEIGLGNYDKKLDVTRNDELGRIAEAVNSMAHDIKQRSAALRENEAWLSMLFETSPVGLALCDMQGKLLEINPAYANIIGQDVETTKQLTYWEITPEDYAADEAKQLESLQKTGRYGPYEKEYLHKDGRRVPVRLQGQIVDRKNEKLIWSSVEDITEKKQAEDALRVANQQLEERVSQRTSELKKANAQLHDSLAQLQRTQNQLVQSEKMASLGGLVAGVAHEINTPVGVGITAISHMQMKLDDYAKRYHTDQLTRDDFEEMLTTTAESSQIIHRNLNRAAELIRGFKQVAVDQTSNEKRDINLHEYLHEIMQSLHPKLKTAGHKVEIDCPDKLMLFTHPGAISQVITNLVMNSITHGFDGRNGGHIKISVDDTDPLRLTYADDGKGMSNETVHKVFEPFYTTRRGQGGSGLGMHIVYNLVTQTLGGNIECSSIEGEGTVFRIELPVNQTDQADTKRDIA